MSNATRAASALASMEAYGPAGADEVRTSGRTFAQEAYAAIKADIIRGIRAPGERLRIERLRSIYGIGPTPLREALQRLSADGLVIAQDNRGFVVSPLDAAEFADLNVARIAVERAALRLSLQNGGLEWEGSVVAATYMMEKEDLALSNVTGHVPDSWERANVAFHASLVAACGSKWLLWTRAHLHELCERYRRAAVSREVGNRALYVEHADIAKAALARDVERTCDLVAQHYNRTAQIFERMAQQ